MFYYLEKILRSTLYIVGQLFSILKFRNGYKHFHITIEVHHVMLLVQDAGIHLSETIYI